MPSVLTGFTGVTGYDGVRCCGGLNRRAQRSRSDGLFFEAWIRGERSTIGWLPAVSVLENGYQADRISLSTTALILP